MIQIQNISHQINGHPILNNITLDIPQNGITALIGANGAGKSTLLSLMARLQPVQSGSIAYNGRDLNCHICEFGKIANAIGAYPFVYLILSFLESHILALGF